MLEYQCVEKNKDKYSEIPSLDLKVGGKGNVPPNQNLIKRCFPNALYILDAPKCLNRELLISAQYCNHHRKAEGL